MGDREVLKVLWDGKIPAKFVVDDDSEENIFYLLLPRVSYLSITTEKVKKHFQRLVEKEEEVWFSYNSIPLKFHLPIGVLYDLLVNQSEDNLPWQINVHFNKFPEDVLFRFPNKDVVESHFMSCLKEADFLKHKGQIISQMQKKDHKQLFLGLQNDKFDQFWAVNRRLMETEENGFKNIPLRCYTDDGYNFLQKLIAPLTEKGQRKTLKDLLAEFSTPVRQAVGAKTHGVEVPLDTELQWLSETLSYPDNFLHLCLIYE